MSSVGGVIDSFSGEYDFLSNFYPSPIEFNDEVYPSVEHFFQAMKTHDPVERHLIRTAPTPSSAKRGGRACSLRSDWEECKLRVMRAGLELKFAEGSELAARLLATGDAHLVEGNTWRDRVWGVYNGYGENLLGVLLVNRRSELRGGWRLTA